MAALGGRVLAYWPVALVAVAFTAMPLALRYLGPGFAAAWAVHGRPIRLELPAARPLALGEVAPPSNGMAVTYDTDADPFERASPQAVTEDGSIPKPSIDLDGGLARPSGPAPRPTERGGVLAVDFDLSRPYESGPESGDGSPIEIRKKVVLNGKEAGSAQLRVGAGSTISISRDALTRLLEQSGRAEMSQQIGQGTASYITFEEMRRQGIDVRYDPLSDQILVAG